MGRKATVRKGNEMETGGKTTNEMCHTSRESTLHIVRFECGNTIQLFGLPVDSELRLIRIVISTIDEC